MFAVLISSAICLKSASRKATISSMVWTTGADRKPQPLRHLWRLGMLDDLGVEPLLDLHGRSRRCPQAEPDRHIGIGIAELGQRRDVREVDAALAVIDVEQIELARLHMRQRHRLVHHLNVVGEDVVGARRRRRDRAHARYRRWSCSAASRSADAAPCRGPTSRRRACRGSSWRSRACGSNVFTPTDVWMTKPVTTSPKTGDRRKALGIVGHLAQQRQVDRRRASRMSSV